MREKSQDSLLDLLKRLAALRRAPRTVRGRYPAAQSPYKPVLLLAVLRRLQQEKQPYIRNRIEFGACARDFEFVYSRLYGGPGNLMAQVAQAYWYLGAGSPKIWALRPHRGREVELERFLHGPVQLKSVPQLQRLVQFAYFAENDWQLVCDRDVQIALIEYLVLQHFTDARRVIMEL